MTEKDEPQVRALDDSLRHAHDAMDRAEVACERIAYDVTGYSLPESDTRASPPLALVPSADLLAGRIESLVSDLAALHQRISAPNVKSLAKGAEDFVQATAASRHAFGRAFG